MASITVRRLDDSLKARLRIRAARHGRSMEEEAREILRGELSSGESRQANLADSIRARFAPLGGIELPPARRGPVRRAPAIGK